MILFQVWEVWNAIASAAWELNERPPYRPRLEWFWPFWPESKLFSSSKRAFRHRIESQSSTDFQNQLYVQSPKSHRTWVKTSWWGQKFFVSRPLGHCAFRDMTELLDPSFFRPRPTNCPLSDPFLSDWANTGSTSKSDTPKSIASNELQTEQTSFSSIQCRSRIHLTSLSPQSSSQFRIVST
jgi:hypothetical protein